jgi:hypothetical protein
MKTNPITETEISDTCILVSRPRCPRRSALSKKVPLLRSHIQVFPTCSTAPSIPSDNGNIRTPFEP